jgi:hypothetical protein
MAYIVKYLNITVTKVNISFFRSFLPGGSEKTPTQVGEMIHRGVSNTESYFISFCVER